MGLFSPLGLLGPRELSGSSGTFWVFLVLKGFWVLGDFSGLLGPWGLLGPRVTWPHMAFWYFCIHVNFWVLGDFLALEDFLGLWECLELFGPEGLLGS